MELTHEETVPQTAADATPQTSQVTDLVVEEAEFIPALLQDT